MAEEMKVTIEDARRLGEEHKAEIIKETSAKDNNGVQELFQDVARRLLRKHKAKNIGGNTASAATG